MEMSKKPEVAPTEVRPAHTRRTFTATFKLKVLQEVEQAPAGQIGALLRRYGLNSSHLTEWRKALQDGALTAPTKRRGPVPSAPNALDEKVRRLELELARMTLRAERAEILVELQKKVSELLSVSLTPPGNNP